ncbi:thiolase family protein [Aminiphilus sp.]|uniref:thiolase family protein n=1 Tax=Aminiphilus sp. TaxID=1872488 RepID=UPI00260A0169|nr:thiolase family protein [Aminiphilus sp.]
MEEVFVVSAARTPGGRMGGALKDVVPEELSRVVLEEVIRRTGLEKDRIDEVILGQAKQSADAPNIARVASLLAGFPESMPSYTVHRQCASGLQALINGVFQIRSGYAEIVLVGGVESMSTAPFYLRKARFGYEAGNGELLDPNTESQPCSQPQETYGRLVMGMTAENLAEQWGISREEQDLFALESHRKAVDAIDSGRFAEEIVPVPVPRKKGQPALFETDEHPRRDTTLEKLASLRPAFKSGGTVTAGNSSGRNDGAAALVLASERALERCGLEPLARFVSMGAAGVDPRVMGIGPVPATEAALRRAGLDVEDMGLVELNEAFAAQSLAVVKSLKLDRSKVNVNGGAIALGHPLGCSGARITVTLLHEMRRRKERFGLATICVAGGLGLAAVFQRV